MSKNPTKMEIKTKVRLIVSCVSCLCLSAVVSVQQVACNPLAFNPIFAYPSPYHSMALQNPMISYPQYDPYTALQSQYLLSQPMHLWPQMGDASRRSLQSMFGRMNDKMSASSNSKQQAEQPETDEQKALDGVPMSLIEPDPPATISERISESFSALNEGVKNHFRSISENFSETLDDIKDAWKPAKSEESRKRKS